MRRLPLAFVPLVFILLGAILTIAAGLRHMLAIEFMPYHAELAGMQWSRVEAGARTLILGMLRILGGGLLAAGLALLWLLIPLRRGARWAAWAALTVAAAVWLPAIFVMLGLRAATPMAEPPPPLVPALVIVALVAIGSAGVLLKSRLKPLPAWLFGAPNRAGSAGGNRGGDGLGPLAGKVALVTGGSRGIGAAIVTRLAQDGAAVALTWHASPDEAAALVRRIEAAGGKALAIRADAADPVAVKAAVQQAVQAFGPIDILVNNAGIALGRSLGEITSDEFDRMIAVNVKGSLVAIQEAVRQMGSGGRIINIGSINSEYASHAGSSLYVMTKAALAGLTRSLSRELGPRAITVNNIMPGPTDTAMNPASGSHSGGVRATMALQRYGHPDEIADMVAYIATARAGFITGASLAVDGGYSA